MGVIKDVFFKGIKVAYSTMDKFYGYSGLLVALEVVFLWSTFAQQWSTCGLLVLQTATG